MKLTLGELKSVIAEASRGPDFEALADEYIRIHNAAAAEFKEAFKAIGARMWTQDEAHAYRGPKNREFIVRSMKFWWKTTHEFPHPFRQVTRYPLTVMDSWPEARKYTKQLRAALDEIIERYQAEWNRVKRNAMRARLKEAAEDDCWGGSQPEEMYEEQLTDDPAYKKKSVYVPDDIKHSINSYFEKMGLAKKKR